VSHGLVFAKRGFTSPGSTFLRSVARLGATDAWDFVNGVWLRDGRVTSDPGLTVTRASVGTAETADGRIVTFGAGELRRTDKGILVEGARTNLFLNSLVGETQSITVTAAAHTLSFYGTGTITLSGVSTDGPLVGTGAGQRVTLTFTPTAGSLTLTVSGTVEYVQLEVGAFASSWIPTEGASVQRAVDQVTASLSGVDYPLSLFVEIDRIVAAGTTQHCFGIDDGDQTDYAAMTVVTGGQASGVIVASSSTQASGATSNVLAVGAVHKIALRVASNNSRIVADASLGFNDTSVNLPAAPTTARFGLYSNSFNPSFQYIRRAAIFSTALTDAQLQAITT
jgi:hypothetical protein